MNNNNINFLENFNQWCKECVQTLYPNKLFLLKSGGLFIQSDKKGNKIHIKKKNRGKFTDYCGGKVTSACISKGKNSPNPTIRKRATFAANSRKWKHQEGGILNKTNPYSVENLITAIYQLKLKEQQGKPNHNYDFAISEEEANKLGYFPDQRGHRDDRVKKESHPSHPSKGIWKKDIFNFTDKGFNNSNFTLFGLNDGGQDPQAILSYKGGIVLPEITVTPNEKFIMNPYDNIKLNFNKYKKGGTIKYTNNGREVPDKCPKCGADMVVKIQGEPVYICKNNHYFGTVKFRE